MPRKKAVAKIPPAPRAEITRIDEANVGRLGLISIQERIPESFTSWTVDFQVEGRPAKLSCEAVTKYGGVPHGLDGDIATALMDLFVESGCPDDGALVTTPYQILKRAGLDDSGRYYANLRMTLFRLRTATYFASEAWRDHRKGNWTTVTFNYLRELEFTSDHSELGLSSNSIIKVRLADPIVRSIRAQYTKPLDLEFLTSLDRPLTRALYRLLDARRHMPEDPSVLLGEFTVNVIEWAEACKIVDQRSNKIRSTLQGAHEDLIARGYLAEATYEGRGQKQQLTYRFADADQTNVSPTPLTPLMLSLTEYGVSGVVARRLVADFGEERVGSRLIKFRKLIEGGYRARNRSALLVDVIRDQEGKYPDVVPSLPAQVSRHERQANHMPTLAEVMQQPEPLEMQVETALKTLQFILRDRLSVKEYGLLRMRLIVGQPEPKEATRMVLAAKKEDRLNEVTDELLRFIHGEAATE